MAADILTRAAAAQLRPREWGALHEGIAVGYKAAPDSGSVRVEDLLRHQQRLTDLIAELADALRSCMESESRRPAEGEMSHVSGCDCVECREEVRS